MGSWIKMKEKMLMNIDQSKITYLLMKVILAISPKPLWQWKLISSITDSLTLLFYC